MTTLTSLHRHNLDELNEMYARGRRPDPETIDGDFEGGVPAVSSSNLLGTLSSPTYLLSKLNLLPWNGKSFSAEEGRGHNRLLLDRVSIAPFEFREETSEHDGDPCLVLDYSIEENPFVLNFIRDEIRTVEDGLVLGQMYFKPTSSLILYFALQRRESQEQSLLDSIAGTVF